jgi:hypothetical protein
MKPAVGRVYVLSNKAIPGLLKIGYTMNTVEGRVKELSSATGIPSEFFIEYQVECRDAAGVEALVHESLNSSRHNNSREFFSISLAHAICEIRKHAKEIIDEEVADSSGYCIINDNSVATFYLIGVSKARNIYRVGIIREGHDFLRSDEFKSLIIDLYSHFDSKFFYECEVIHAQEFTHVDNESLENMKNILDGNIKRLKVLNIDIFDTNGYRSARGGVREYDKRLNGKYDLRTLPIAEYKAAQIYKSSLTLLEPIAKACIDKATSRVANYAGAGHKSRENSDRVDLIRKMGV